MASLFSSISIPCLPSLRYTSLAPLPKSVAPRPHSAVDRHPPTLGAKGAAHSSLSSSADVADAVVAGEDAVSEPRPLRVGIICGGPSAERGISLNSARSVLDHIQGVDIHVNCYYIDANLNPFSISSAQMYSNTPADFDFKLNSLAQSFSSLSTFIGHLSTSVDIVFSVIHGRFGEDGGIQELLEKANIPFVGTTSNECRKAFDKYVASGELSTMGFITVPNFLVQDNNPDKAVLAKWFMRNQLNTESAKVVVKPTRAGSSIGVSVAYGLEDSVNKACQIIYEGIDDKALIEVFLGGGCEFTAIVIDVASGFECNPVVLLPSEVELCNNVDIDGKDTIFNYRRKYLPTQQVAYHTPPRFSSDVIECIRKGASMLFKQLGLRDFARIDGWFLPSTSKIFTSEKNVGKYGNTKFGDVIFTDINLISGMEQTSFLFQQASKVGFSHSDILRTIILRACSRYPSLSLKNGISCIWPRKMSSLQELGEESKVGSKQKVFVIFGGDTSERQVSLMSGTNVWLNLHAFDDIDVTPCLLAPTDGGFSNVRSPKVASDALSRTVWCLPYSLVLRHTTEEVLAACMEAAKPERVAVTSQLREQVMLDLSKSLRKQKWFSGFNVSDELPRKFLLGDWIKHAKEVNATVFIAVHGGIGEDGTMQSMLEGAGIPYTGPGVDASKICMDKMSTSLALWQLKDAGVRTIPKKICKKHELFTAPLSEIWNDLITNLGCETLCVKPARDGCSTGVARLCCLQDLCVYVDALRKSLLRLAPNSLSKAHGMIEMPYPPPELLIFESFIETDEMKVSSNSTLPGFDGLSWKGKSRWVEITVGVVGEKGRMQSLTPSITVKERGDILSLEEKFQGGTGINLTPPPISVIRKEALEKCEERVELIANSLGLEGFSRIDAFVDVDSGEVLIIEVNTVPGMTPSTVLIHQALEEHPPLYPQQFFRKLLNLASTRSV